MCDRWQRTIAIFYLLAEEEIGKTATINFRLIYQMYGVGLAYVYNEAVQMTYCIQEQWIIKILEQMVSHYFIASGMRKKILISFGI